jgi:hypothetical protein
MYDRLLMLAEAARGYLDKGWTQRHTARYPNGIYCNPSDPKAVSFCMLGAIEAGRAMLGETYSACCVLTDHVERLIPVQTVLWNDDPSRTKEEVLAVFDDLIDELRDTGAKSVKELEWAF